MQRSETNARVVSVRFRNYKALEDFQIRLKDTNILVGPNNAGKSTIVGAFRALAVALRRINGRKPDVVNGPSGRRYLHFAILGESDESAPSLVCR
jgi:predicted ATPase